MDEPLLTTRELADVLRRSESTIRYWRHIGFGPKGVKVGRGVLYRRADVEAWLAGLESDELDATPTGAA
jgi:excisionase family DNA binding protein